MKFSERLKIIEVDKTIQLNSMSEDLRNGIWNIVLIFWLEPIASSNFYFSRNQYQNEIKHFWHRFLKRPLDEIPESTESLKDDLRSLYFKKYQWYEVYDFIEYIAQNPIEIESDEMINVLNSILKEEMSAYRFSNESSELAPIVDESQLQSIQTAINDNDSRELAGIKTHLTTALSMLSDRQNPDYRNSIKESISAVETQIGFLTGKPKQDFSISIKELRKNIDWHGALASGFNNIYGYTSDEQGVRHGMSENKEIHLEDALFMLVSCSAFINYLSVKAEKSGLPKV